MTSTADTASASAASAGSAGAASAGSASVSLAATPGVIAGAASASAPLPLHPPIPVYARALVKPEYTYYGTDRQDCILRLFGSDPEQQHFAAEWKTSIETSEERYALGSNSTFTPVVPRNRGGRYDCDTIRSVTVRSSEPINISFEWGGRFEPQKLQAVEVGDSYEYRIVDQIVVCGGCFNPPLMLKISDASVPYTVEEIRAMYTIDIRDKLMRGYFVSLFMGKLLLHDDSGTTVPFLSHHR